MSFCPITISDTSHKSSPFRAIILSPTAAKVMEAVSYSYPPVILDPAADCPTWSKSIEGVKNEAQSIILSELIRSGVVDAAEKVEKYACLWQTQPNFPNLDKFENKSTLSKKEKETLSFLEAELKADLPHFEDIHAFLRAIPSRRIFDKLWVREVGGKLIQAIKDNWQTIGKDLEKVLNDDRLLYQKALKETFKTEKEGKVIRAVLMLVDLNYFDRTLLPVEIRVIDQDRLLYLVNDGGQLKAGVINQHDTSTIKMFFRSIAFQESQYLLHYFPKLEFSGSSVRFSLDYVKKDQGPENLLGKIDYDNDLPLAIENFTRAFKEEDQLGKEEKKVFSSLLSLRELQRMQNEPTLELDGILKLVFIMGTRSCKEAALSVFGITAAEYSRYEDKIIQLLEQGKQSTREAFLAEAIKICGSRAALAAVICYNLLFPLGEIGNNALFLHYPKAFKNLPGVQDQAGSIYHFMGCFFAAYSLQRFMVDRYHSDKSFQSLINEQIPLLFSKTTLTPWGIREEDLLNVLQIMQFKILGTSPENRREIISLAGVFFEEVILDRDLSLEIKNDFQGIAAGHAAYELVSGKELLPSGKDIIREKCVEGFSAFSDLNALNILKHPLISFNLIQLIYFPQSLRTDCAKN